MMDIQNGSIEFILWLQQFSPTLDAFFLFFTSLGDETFFLLFLPLIYWCIDRRIGARLVALFLFSSYLNILSKLLADQPRPFDVDPRVQALVEESTGGFPSGHAQNTTVVWGYLAIHYRQRWLWWLALALLILVPFSRLYVGVHFPADLLGGYLIGVPLLFLYLRWEPGVEQWLTQRTLVEQLIIAIVPPILMVLLLPAAEPIAVAATGTLLGMGIGYALEHRWVQFAVEGSRLQRVLRYITGGLPLVILYLGLRVAFAELEPETLWRFLRYAILGFWAAFGAPWLFVRTRLATAKGQLIHARP